MKRKFLTSLLVASTVVGGMGTLSSCKDNTEDIRAEFRQDTSELQKQINALVEELKAQKAAFEAMLKDNVDKKNFEEVLKASAKIQEMDRKIAGLTNLLGEIPADVKADNFADWIAAIQATAGTSSSFIEDAFEGYTPAQVRDAIIAASWVKEQKENIEAMMQGYEEMGLVFNELIQTLNDWREAIDQKFDAIDTSILNLEEGYQGLSDKINNELVPAIEANKAAIDEIKAIMNRQVTGVIVQGTHNPVFGSFSAPLGITSNILMLNYGYADKSVTLPNTDSDREYNIENPFTATDVAVLAKAGINLESALLTVPAGAIVPEKEGNAGKVYVTVNPANVNFEGQTISLVNSQDEPCGITLSSLRKSSDVLKFGFGRADNGFYEAAATLTPEQIEAVKVEIEPGLKDAFLDAYHNRTKADFAYLLKKLYNQFNGILPAQGLKASYEGFDGAPVNVYSEYSIAATAFKPLSYAFLVDKQGKHLPIISPISGDEFKFDPSKFEFPVEFPTITVNGVDLSFTFEDVQVTYDGQIGVTIKMPQFDGDGIFTGYKDETVYAPQDDINDLVSSITDAINEKIGEMTEEMKADFKTQIDNLVANLEQQINDAMDNVSGQIEENLKNVVEEINNQLQDKIGGYVNRFNNLIDKYNSLAQRLNKYLDNPNMFMQPMVVYNLGKGGIGQVSNSLAVPTRFKMAGGNAIELILTSYNAEIAVPAYKKYIVVTNVYKNGDKSVNADNNTECLDVLKAANKAKFFNEVLDGQQLRVALSASKPGYTYEIAYQALDYHGITSTRKYYIQVVAE